MSFNGTLKTVTFPDLLQWLQMGQKTGCLTLLRDQFNKHIYFRDGSIIYATSIRDEDRFGGFLIRNGLINDAQLTEALELQRQTGKMIGETLIDMELISKEELARQLRNLIEGIIYDIFTWKDGSFEFIEGKMPPMNSDFPNLTVESVIKEGGKKIDEWAEIRKVIPTMDTALQMPAPSSSSNTNITLSSEEFQLLAVCDGKRVVAEICQESMLSEFETCRLLAKMVTNGFLEVRGVQVEDSKDQLKRKKLKQLIELYQIPNRLVIEKMEIEGGPEMRFKIDDIYQQTAEEYKDLFTGTELQEDGSFDYDTLVRNLFYFSGDERINVLTQALGAFVERELEFAKDRLGLFSRKSFLKTIKNSLKDAMEEKKELLEEFKINEHLDNLVR